MAGEAGKSAILFVVATPIGNLEDITYRAVRVLSEVDVIAAEDTRHSAVLLRHFGIATPVVAFHEHNERQTTPRLLERLKSGQSIALISDAGTPLISDPGYRLVQAVREQGLPVSPVPGPSAVTAALSVCGLPTDRFVFEGFLPARAAARRQRIEGLAAEPRTVVLFESPHRIRECLADLEAVLGSDRRAVLARELTKRFETILDAPLGELALAVVADEDQRRGEFVLLLAGADAAAPDEDEAQRIVDILLEALPLAQAATLAARITGSTRNRVYRRAIARRGE